MEDENSYRRCPSCAGKNAKVKGTKNDFRIYECLNCGTLFSDRLPEANEAEDYDSYYSEANLEVPKFIYRRLKDLFGGLSSHRKTNRWLDIGFGAGTLMKVAAELGWEVYGVEISKPAIEQAEKFGFKVFHGDLYEAGYNEGFFDVVTASEILEHLYEPQKLLNEVSRILRPGGLLWGTTPSAKGISPRILGVDWTVIAPPEHIQLFSKKGMYGMLKRAGFSKIKLQTHGTNPHEIINRFRPPKSGFDRVQSSYQLNEELESSPLKKTLKKVLNQTLNLAQIGDSLKIYAVK